MAKAHVPTEQDAIEATRIVLAGLARGDDVPDLAKELVALNPNKDKFVSDALLGLGADVLDLAGVSRERPIVHERLRDRFLPECEFVGRQNRKFQYALLCIGALRGGIKVDLAEELYWWRTDDFWHYALCAFVAWTRAAADHAGISIAVICERLAALHSVELRA